MAALTQLATRKSFTAFGQVFIDYHSLTEALPDARRVVDIVFVAMILVSVLGLTYELLR
jgi:hypothetical protein